MRCFGTPQHIRNKFGTGFYIEVKARIPSNEETIQVTRSMLDMSTVTSKELRDINDKEYFTSHEAASILTEAGVPYLVIDSILNLEEKQKLRQ